MSPTIRTLSITVLLAAAATAAQAQTNPLARSSTQRDSFYYGALHPAPQQSTALGSPLAGGAAIGRPTGQFGPPVTPVPEPSEWAMMLAGLGLVGFIVRRNSKRA